MKKLLLRSAFCLVVCLAMQSVVQADFFQYTDKDGTVVFVDDESKVPKKYRKKTKTTATEPSELARSTTVKVVNNSVFVPVRLSYGKNTVDAWMLVDTGASTTTISPELAQRLGIDRRDTVASAARVADGRFIRTYSTRVDYIKVGPKMKQNVAVSITPTSGPQMSFDGLLGMNFLGDFRHKLDINAQMINWEE